MISYRNIRTWVKFLKNFNVNKSRIKVLYDDILPLNIKGLEIEGPLGQNLKFFKDLMIKLLSQDNLGKF